MTSSVLKTKIQSAAVFDRRFEANPDEEVDRRISMIEELATLFDPYSGEEREVTEDRVAEFTELNIAELVAGALEDRFCRLSNAVRSTEAPRGIYYAADRG